MQAGADSDPDAVHFGPGEYFGDVSLLLSEPTETTIKSLGETAPVSSLMHVWILGQSLRACANICVVSQASRSCSRSTAAHSRGW